MQGDSLPKSGNFLPFGAAFPPPATDWREILVGQADPCATRLCQISHQSMQRVASAGRKCRFLAWE